MNISQASETQLRVNGTFDLNRNNELNEDLQRLVELISKNIDFKTQKITFIGFAESLNKRALSDELEESGIMFKQRADDLLLYIKDVNQLKKAYKLWSDEAGGAGYFILAAGPKDVDIEKNIDKYLRSRQKSSEALLIVEDSSDGDKNEFIFESTNKLIIDN